ncbi:MAG: glycosyltransferase, partial [Gammaproteobacteria bacterium]|nr:glycosyltransferase [Gammaproteobacteria bacterium]
DKMPATKRPLVYRVRKNILIFGHNDATQFIDIYNQYTALFDPDKYEVTVIFLTGQPSEETKRRTLAENPIFLHLPKKKIRMLKIGAIQKLLAICREKKFEIVICHRYKPAYIMLWVAQFCKIPLIINVMHELKALASLHRRGLIRFLARKNVLFAGVSNAVRDDMRKSLHSFPSERVITLYNTIDIHATEPLLLSRENARKALNLPQEAIVFGNIARLAHNKDQKSLLQAFSQIKTQCPAAKLVLIGDGKLEQTLKQQAEAYGLQQDILFTGFLPNGVRYMRAFDCFVLSSIQEAFGRVLIEAMIAKCPIIATRVNGIPEVMGETGLLVAPHEPSELAAALQHIYSLSAAQRENMGQIAYQRVTQHFSIPVFEQQFWQAAEAIRLSSKEKYS